MTQQGHGHESLVERFHAAVAAGRFRPEDGAPANVGGDHGLLSCIVGVEDEALFAERTGIAMPIVLTLTPVLQDLPSDEAVEAATTWLQAAEGGLDDAAAEHVLICILGDEVIAARLLDDPEAQEVCAQLVALHRAASCGEPPPGSEWRAVRGKAVAAVSRREQAGQLPIAVLATAAWPIAAAPELLRDVLHDEVKARAFETACQTGVQLPTEADWEAFRDVIDALKAGGKTKAEAFAAVNGVLAEEHPDLRARLKVNELVMPRAEQAAARFVAANLSRGLIAAGVSRASSETIGSTHPELAPEDAAGISAGLAQSGWGSGTQ